VWSDWLHPLLYVQADTVVRWQRERFRKFWARLSNPQRQRRGCPGIAAELSRLIEQIAANPLWRAPRIRGELKMLDIAISERTPQALMSDTQYCKALSATYRRYRPNQIDEVSADAMARCETADAASAIPVLERSLTAMKIPLPARTMVSG